MKGFQDYLNGLKKKVKKTSLFGLKSYQLKNIIEQYNEKQTDEKKIIKGYKNKNIEDLERLIKLNGINITNYKIIDKNPYAVYQNIYKKAGINQYNEENQISYLDNLNNNDRYNNPLQALNEYTNKEGKKEFLSPLEHQKKFILQFIYSKLRGAIVFHGVGSGKTLTAVISSYYYLKLYPKNNVIVISPPALLFNFVAGMAQYGLDINDNRYSFYTYDKYARNPKIAKNSLLIVDEAHKFRTFIRYRQEIDPNNFDNKKEVPITNLKGVKIMDYGSYYCDKILLLTGTAFVNVLYDVENLLAMIDNRKPVPFENYDNILSRVESVKDYFDYKISYYKNDDDNEFFPKRIEKIIPIYMTEEQQNEYNKLKAEGAPNSQSDYPNSFYSAEKYASNMIDKKYNPKLKFIIDEILNKKNQKFIVYSGLYDYGIQQLAKALNEKNIKYTMISGRQTTLQKNDAKLYYNYYNFGNNNFFDLNNIPTQYHKYINNEYRILLITRAGAEGVDTINTQNIILFDFQWNDALSEQIIARAIRFKSHFGLDKKDRYVNVLRPLLLFKSNKELMDDILKGDVDFIELKTNIKDSVREQRKI